MRHVAEQQSTTKPLTEPVLLILVSLASKPQHGYALMRDISDLSQGRVEVTTGTLYGALRRLLEDGWIERFEQEDTSREKQAYRLTAIGRRHLEMELDRMKQVTRVAAARLRQKPNMLLRRAYSMGLVLYPADFQAQFGAEMVTVFEKAAAQRRSRGSTFVLLFFVKELLGLLMGAARERISRDHAIRSHDDLPFPSDAAGTERYLEIVSKRLRHAIANHEFVNARYYDQQDRKARALLAELRAQPS
ncbi:MAG TPA: helix-turn-helix transcriptional regulator [Candidatus Acidoferrales bacterium]|nr:helix-turn-helix transcriptional regulator [Candidatus Acidoferrales bacterium]